VVLAAGGGDQDIREVVEREHVGVGEVARQQHLAIEAGRDRPRASAQQRSAPGQHHPQVRPRRDDGQQGGEQLLAALLRCDPSDHEQQPVVRAEPETCPQVREPLPLPRIGGGRRVGGGDAVRDDRDRDVGGESSHLRATAGGGRQHEVEPPQEPARPTSSRLVAGRDVRPVGAT
jgi:hypothetical protein